MAGIPTIKPIIAAISAAAGKIGGFYYIHHLVDTYPGIFKERDCTVTNLAQVERTDIRRKTYGDTHIG